jgi:hypothetical protein
MTLREFQRLLNQARGTREWRDLCQTAFQSKNAIQHFFEFVGRWTTASVDLFGRGKRKYTASQLRGNQFLVSIVPCVEQIDAILSASTTPLPIWGLPQSNLWSAFVKLNRLLVAAPEEADVLFDVHLLAVTTFILGLLFDVGSFRRFTMSPDQAAFAESLRISLDHDNCDDNDNLSRLITVLQQRVAAYDGA